MKYFLLVILLLTGSVVYSQEPDCKKFKTGKFEYPHLPGKVSLRTDSVQESYSNGNLEMLWSVKWITGCQYEIVCLKILNDNIPMKVGDRIVATIHSTKENCYTYSSVLYNKEYPEGLKLPNPATMCVSKEK